MRLDYRLRGTGKLTVEINRRVALAGFGEHERIDTLGAGELREVMAGLLDGSRVVLARVRILLLQLGGVEIELPLRELLAIGIGGVAGGPPLHQDRREKQLRAFIVVGSGDQVSLESVVRRSVLRTRRRRQGTERLQHAGLSLPEQHLPEPIEIDTAGLGIEIVAGVEAPTIAPGRAVMAPTGELHQR